MSSFKFIDLFCGIGGFHLGAVQNGGECVFACDIDQDVRRAYHANFGLDPKGDITHISGSDIPDHDMLCAGFPCQPFSIIGNRRGFSDIRGTLFFDIARIIQAKKPKFAVLENVKQLATHDQGRTLKIILETLKSMGYSTYWKILNALDYGLPQKRERLIIVCFREYADFSFPPKETSYKPLLDILEKDVDEGHYASDRIVNKRKETHKSNYPLAIWHENKGGHISSYPFSCALRAAASYNYLLVNGERRLTPRELLRLQGFPDVFKIVCNDNRTRKQAGNAVPVPIISKVIREVLNASRTKRGKESNRAAS
ncbi:MAG: hhaIM 1 [Alphaproteobacteria bacterium]|jgi:DNA (cytosine-5)-methyltransferase 1|nr:hhaIM 1 [Alphaproteobacteria bacterium]